MFFQNFLRVLCVFFSEDNKKMKKIEDPLKPIHGPEKKQRKIIKYGNNPSNRSKKGNGQ